MYKPNVSIAFPEAENKIQKKQEKNLTKSCSRHAETSKNTPIEVWLDLIHSDNDPVKIEQTLRQTYESNLPTLGEIIFTSACQFNCQHCIYPADYSRFNTNLSSEQWIRIIENIYNDLRIKTFIHCGRSLDNTGVEVLKWMRRSFNDIQFGLVDSVVSLIPYLDELAIIKPDWIDVSIDGMEKEHDLQRNQVGSFKKTLSTISYLKQEDIASKINILICLTNLNKDSIVDLIEFMNQKGFKNFFISPISTFSDFGPPNKLRVLGRDFAKFIKSLYLSLHKFKDTWIEFNIFFDLGYLKDIKTFYPELWDELKPEQKHLSCKTIQGDNEFYINYYPLALNGIREFLVNSNGCVIFPQAIRKGQLSDEDIIGNLVQQNVSEVIKRLRDLKFKFYVDALLMERNYIGGK